MKLIANSIDADKLQFSLSHVDFEDKMATYELTKNGVQSKINRSSEKNIQNNVDLSSKLSNGICNSPKRRNGYIDDGSDEDFQLVLESSSEDGSPEKKICDDDAVSAPQIVQEIEDLLGINGDNVGIDEELEKDVVVILEDSEKEEEDFVEEIPLVTPTSQDVQKKVGLSSISLSAGFNHTNPKDSGKNNSNKCVSVEEKNITTKPANQENSLIINQKGNTEKKNSEEQNNSLSQGSNVSDTSVEWVVLDAIESEEEVSEYGQGKSIVIEDANVVLKKALDSEIILVEGKDQSRAETTVNSGEISAEEKEHSIAETTTDYEKITVEGKDHLNGDNTTSSENKSVEGMDLSHLETTTDSEKTLVEGKDCLIGDSESKSNEDKDLSHLDTVNNFEKTSVEGKPHLIGDSTTGSENKSFAEKELLHVEITTESEQKLTEEKRGMVAENALDSDKTSDQSKEQLISDNFVEAKDRPVDNASSSTDSPLKRTAPVKEEKGVEKKPKLERKESDEIIQNSNQVLKRPLDATETKSQEMLSKRIKLIEPKNEKSIKSVGGDDPNNLIDNSQPKDKKIGEGKLKDDSKKDVKDSDEIKTYDEKVVSEKNMTIALNEEGNIDNEMATDSEVEAKETSTIIKQQFQKILNKNQTGECDSTTNDSGASGNKAINDLNEENKENLDNIISSTPNSIETILISDDSLKVSMKDGKENSQDEVSMTRRHSEEEGRSFVSKPLLESKSKDSIPDKKVSAIPTTDLSEKPSKGSISEAWKSLELKVQKNNSQYKDKMKSSNSPFELLNKSLSDQQQLSNLDEAIESVVNKARKQEVSTHFPILKKFHKDQLRRLTRSQLEEAVVLKVCEAVTDRSEIGQMRLRCKRLEEKHALWRKKALQLEKQNRELDMVVKRFLAEAETAKEENRMCLPIRVTRSVGLQVVLTSAVTSNLVIPNDKALQPSDSPRSSNTDSTRSSNTIQQQSQIRRSKPRPIQSKPEPPKHRSSAYQPQPSSSSRKMGKSSKSAQSVAPINPTPAAPIKIPLPQIQPKPSSTKKPSTSTRDLEVIDLTDREDKRKISPPQSVGQTIRVAPSTQVCFVQSSSTDTPSAPMAYIVQKPGQRQQFIVATSSTSPTRPVGVANARQRSPVTLPVFRAGGQIIPVQTNSATAGVRTSNSTVATSRPIPAAIRMQPQVSTVLKHPAPLPAAPPQPVVSTSKAPPPKPQLKIAKTVNGIMLSWSMILSKDIAEMSLYQLFAYQEGQQVPSTNLWKKVGDVKALPLPMACTLTQFVDGHKYHFAVRAVDVYGRVGPFSQPNTILLTK